MSKVCCEPFKKMLPTFTWFSTESGDMLMPSIRVKDTYLRINYCPSCGKEVRSIQISEEEYKQYNK